MRVSTPTSVVLVGGLLLLAVTLAAGVVITDGDGFEDGDVDEWSTAGTPIEFGAEQTQPSEGSWHANFTSSDIEADYALAEDLYVVDDDYTITAEVNVTDGSRAAIQTLNTTTDDGWATELDYTQPSSVTLRLRERTGGSLQTEATASESVTPFADGYIRLVLQRDGGDVRTYAVGADGATSTTTVQGTTQHGGRISLYGSPTDRVYADNVTVRNEDADEPSIVASSLSPSDGADLSSTTATLEAEVRDPDFSGTDAVEVAFTVNGSVVDTQTIHSNQTVSTTVDVGGGEHTWSVEATDSIGLTTDTATLSFATPGAIVIHDGDEPATLLDDRTVNAEFVGTSDASNFQTERSTTNGTVPLDGLPAEELRVRLNATGYADRIIHLPSSSASRRTVMYNLSTASTFEQCFQLDSRGAGFAPDETQLVVQAYLDGRWENAGSKYFGAANLACFSLQDGEDYRLAVTDGENTRNLGGYEADQSFASEVVTLLVEDITFGLDRGEDYRWQAQLTNETGSPEILFKIDSRDEPLEDLELTIWERDNRANELDALSTAGPADVYSANFPLTPDQARQEWVLNWTAEYPDGTIATGQTIVSLAGPAGTIIPDGVPSEVLLGLMVGLVILLGMVFSQLHAGIGMGITVAFAGLLVLLGVLPVPIEVLVLAMALAVVGYIGFGVFGR